MKQTSNLLLLLLLPTLAESFTPQQQRRISPPTQPLESAAAIPVAEGQGTSDPRVGVLLLNLGGPETGDDVEGALIV